MRDNFEVPCCILQFQCASNGISNCTHFKAWSEINYPFSSIKGFTVEVCEWINDLISAFTVYVNIYQCWDESYSMLVKGKP